MMRYETFNVNMKTTCKRRDRRFSRHSVSNVINTEVNFRKTAMPTGFRQKP